MNNIIVCGAIAYDRIMYFPGKFSEQILAGKTHILNVSFTVGGVKESFGGTGGNIAYSLAMLGEKPKVVAVAGKDFSKYKAWLLKNKIDISGVKVVKDELTASAQIITDRDDNQITAYWPGSKEKSPRPPLSRGGNQIAIIAPDIVARMREYAKIFRQKGVPYIFDPGQQIAYYSKQELLYAIRGAVMLIGNDYEIQLVMNKLKINLAGLQKMEKILVITKGGKGVEIYSKGGKLAVPAAKKKKFIDPTGGGDAVRAGFIKGLIGGLNLKQCARLAMVTSAYAVENQGTQNHKFTWKEVRERYYNNYKERI